jgi:dGTPase
LNLTFRSLASILKYDEQIITRNEHEELTKGYYADEQELVEKIKEAAIPKGLRPSNVR